MGLRFGLVCLVVVLLFGEAWTGPVVGIDFGTSWYKVAMIQGHNLDLVLDGAGDRRRNTLLGMHGEERVFGRDAEAMLKRYPTEVFKNILDILGKPYDEVKHLDLIHFPFFEKIQSINGRNSTQISLNPSNENGRAYILPEEIMAMFFKEAMAMASTKAGSKVVDCVVVVPNFYTHHQRQALIDAAKIAEVDILGFLNGNTAAALTYGLNRDKEELEVHRRVVIYDMGYGSTKVSVIEMKQGEDQKKNKTVPVIQVIGHGWDVSLGGRDFDLRIAQFFAKQAEKKVGEGKILGNKRTLERLVKESQRVKEVLSANLDTQIAIPDLVPDYDFFGTITREQFEEASKDLISRSLEPVKKALESAQVTVGDIDYIEVIGGGSRVPAIQRALAEYFGKAAEHHLNGDEAAVFGAAFFAATQSTSFRVKNDILLKDATGFGIDVEVVEGVNLEKSLSKAHLIKPLNRHGSLKKLSFHVNEGELPSRVVLRLSYDSTLAEGAPTEISELVFTGFPLRSDNILDAPKITLSFRLNNHGLLVVETADLEYTVLTLEKDPSSTTSKKSDKDKDKDSKEGAEKASDSAASGEGEEKEKGANEGAESGAEKETEKLIEVKRTKKVHLTVDVKPLGVLPLVAKDVVDAKKYLKDLDRADKLKRETEEARNSIEALVYNAQEKLNEDEDLQKFTNSEEKEKVIEALQEAGNWLYDEGDGATFEVLKSKLKELQGKVDRILNRRVEYEKRNESVGYYLGAIMYVKNETSNITNSHEVEVDEYERFIEYLTTEQEEILRLYDLQNARELDQDPLFTAAELEKKTKEIQRRVRAFKIRPKRKPKVVVEEKAEEIKEETEKAAENVAENVSEKAEEIKEETETRRSESGHEHEDGAQGPDEL